MNTSARSITTTANPRTAHPAPMWRRVISQTRYEALTMLRNGEQLLLLVILPVIALVALSRMDLLDSVLPAGASRLDYAVPGVLALSVISNAFSGQGIQTGFDRRYGVLRQLATTPLGRSGLIAGKLGAILLVLAAQTVLIGAVAWFMGWHPSASALLEAAPLLVLGAVAFTGLGLLAAGTMRAEATLAVVNLLWVLLAVVGGTLAPASALPEWLAPLIGLLPSAALADGLRHVMVPDDPGALLGPVVVLAAWAAIAWAATARWFRWS
ncbi:MULTISPECIES: ABC transporter permease [Kocuria]|uniref:ABC transporter permease n=1 Tax=Kocuria TaxID=57493 RepID=UPI000B1BE458|nr:MULTISPECIES: ABC transporter permease [Kocuria]